jgi:putative copper export protein
MMPIAYWVSVTTHILAALFWLGGIFFLGLVGAPVLRGVEPAALRQRLFHQLGVRFRAAGWLAIAVLIATGFVNLHYRGLLRWDGVLTDPEFWRTPLGHALGVKLAAVVAMLIVSGVHDFVLGPRAGRASVGSEHATRLRRRASMVARVNAFLGVVVVIAAARLARGG